MKNRVQRNLYEVSGLSALVGMEGRDMFTSSGEISKAEQSMTESKWWWGGGSDRN